MTTSDKNRLCLFAAFVVMWLSTRASLPADYSLFLATVEAIGSTIAVAIPAFIGQVVLKKPRMVHGFTLAFALLAAFGEWYHRSKGAGL